jgi:hypothetical protein
VCPEKGYSVSEKLSYTSDRELLIGKLRQLGFSNEKILATILCGEYGGNPRRELILEWGAALGLEASEALRIAQQAGLIPSVHPPRGTKAGKPRGKDRGK